MKSLKHSIESFLSDEDGASAVEYGLLVALVVAGVAMAAKGLFDNTGTSMTKAATCISTPSAANCQ